MQYLKWCYLALVLLIAAPAYAGPVDINSADAAMLAESINGVGERKAAMIVEYRERHGPFSSVDDLAAVNGIGAATIDRNRHNLVAGTPAK